MSVGRLTLWTLDQQRAFDYPGITSSELMILLILKGVTADQLIGKKLMNESEVVLRDGVIRVSINDDGTCDILDFTMPSFSNRAKKRVPLEDVPEWIRNALAVLQIADPHEVVDGVGYRLPNMVFYLLDPEHTKLMEGEPDE